MLILHLIGCFLLGLFMFITIATLGFVLMWLMSTILGNLPTTVFNVVEKVGAVLGGVIILILLVAGCLQLGCSILHPPTKSTSTRTTIGTAPRQDALGWTVKDLPQ